VPRSPAERPNRHAGNDLVDSLRLAGVTGDSYSLIEMKSDAIASKLAIVENDGGVIWTTFGKTTWRYSRLVRQSRFSAWRNRSLLALLQSFCPLCPREGVQVSRHAWDIFQRRVIGHQVPAGIEFQIDQRHR